MYTGRGCQSSRSLVGVVAIAVLLVETASAADRVPGTALTLEPPTGFSPATQFPGFQKADAGSSIMVNEIPGPISQLRAGMTTEGLASKGMHLLASTETTVAGREALLLHASQVAAGTDFEKWMVVFGDQTRSVILVATFPKVAGDSLREPLKLSLLSAQWNPENHAVHFEGLPFRVSETPELKVANRMSNMLLLTMGGVGAPVPPSDPLVVVGTSVSEVEIPDLEAFARDRLTQTAEIAGLSSIEGEAATVDHLPAYELVADARDKKTGTSVRVYQLVVADEGRYFVVQGLVGAAQAARFLPQFRDLGRSLRRSD